MPEQVASNLPHAFKEKYLDTFAIIDGSEIFSETSSDLHMLLLHGATTSTVTQQRFGTFYRCKDTEVEDSLTTCMSQDYDGDSEDSDDECYFTIILLCIVSIQSVN